eukprot:jgi/Psemu1/36277/gm1.36277_g
MHPGGAMLQQGLIIAGFLLTQIERSQPASANDFRYNSAHGASPTTVLCSIYEDLATPYECLQDPCNPPREQRKSLGQMIWDHKFNKAGVNYKLDIALASNTLIWMNGPFKAGQNDVTIFVENGLEQCLRYLCCKKCIGDGDYRGDNDAASTPNAHDGYGVKRFKTRALKCHEGFNNGMTKVFRILHDRFRHSVKKSPRAFEAVHPLYNVLVDDLVNKPEVDMYAEIGAAWCKTSCQETGTFLARAKKTGKPSCQDTAEHF